MNMPNNPSGFNNNPYMPHGQSNPIYPNNPISKKIDKKKEEELENEIRDHLKCYICLTKVMKPKMCKYCKRICCEACIDKWLLSHDYCGICKHKVTSQDMITLPFLDDMSNYFINNIDNHPKNKENNNNIINQEKINEQNNINNINKENQNSKEICFKHNNKIDYYCVQCDKYFCSNCLVFFGEEVKKHSNHLILQVSKMNDLGIKEAIKEYRKLSDSKRIIDYLIGLINLKLKENEIKKVEINNFMNLIRDLNVKKIDETSQELQNMLKFLKSQKDSVESSIMSIPNGFNNIVNSNDYAQGSIVFNELKKINKIDGSLEGEIKEKSKINPKLFVENYETDLLEIDIPYGGQYNEGLEIVNKRLNIMPNFPSRLIMKYLQNKIYISFCVDINLPLNAPNYPKFYTYIIFRNKAYGLEFINLSNQSFPQDFVQQGQDNNIAKDRQQINGFEFEANQFLSLAGQDKKIRMKIYVIKTYYL